MQPAQVLQKGQHTAWRLARHKASLEGFQTTRVTPKPEILADVRKSIAHIERDLQVRWDHVNPVGFTAWSGTRQRL